MSKITDALKKADEERFHVVSPTRESDRFLNNNRTEGKMLKSWLTWGFIVAVVAVFVVLNYQGGKDAVSLSEIFPEDDVATADLEYEFVEDKVVANKPKEPVKPVAEQVNIEALKEPAKQTLAVATPQTLKETAAYTIQIASFKDKKRAEEALATIRTKVPSAYLVSRDLGDNGIWYRIYAGQFDQRSDAEVSLNNIRQNYDSSFIISPKGTK
ncbi:MAG: SPOR domain-containing protein [Candidatus Omnitrophica bacterium]|nr:SPOR domain-containing protein [Candidatus Omnitrophota bacterium]